MGSARENIPILCEAFGLAFETGLVIDRSLADNGLRTKGKGRIPPDMTREDCLNFLIACMTYTVAKRAHEDVLIWRSATTKINIPDFPEDKLDWDDDDTEIIDEDRPLNELIMLKNRREANKFRHEFPFFQYVEGQEMTLVQFLLFVMHHIHGEFEDSTRFIIDPQSGHAEFIFTGTFGQKLVSFLFYPEKGRLKDYDDFTTVHRAGWIYAEGLDSIARRSGDPLSEQEGPKNNV